MPPTGTAVLHGEKESTDGGYGRQIIGYGVVILILLVGIVDEQRGGTAGSVIVGIAVTFGTLFMACLGIWFLRRWMSTKKWKSTKAIIQMSEPYETIDYQVISQGNVSPVRKYKIDVSYHYSVKGRAYEGTYYSIENPHCMFKQKSSCDTISQRYKGRSEGVIYYSDSDPEDAILVRENLSAIILICCFVLIPVFLLTGIGGIYYFFNLLRN